MTLPYGFAHAYEFHYGLFPNEPGPLARRVERAARALREMGAGWWRPHIPWNRVEPRILRPGLKPSDVTEAMVADYAAGGFPGVDWAETDLWVNEVTRAGIRLHIALAVAYVSQIPTFERGSTRVLFTPGVVDPEVYLGHLSLHARATVRRYRDRVRVWQLENELNNACEVRLINRWRAGKWAPWRWLTRVLTTLHDAVRREDPRALTTHNFSCDTPSLHPVYSWKRDVDRWLPYLDWVGLDQYPNYLRGRKNRGAALGALVARVRERVQADKPVWILETGIPAAPERKGFSEDLQRDYYQAVLESVEGAGGAGVLFYCLVSQEGHPGNEWHKRRSWNDVENHWGLFRADGSPRPAYDWLKARFGPAEDPAGV